MVARGSQERTCERITRGGFEVTVVVVVGVAVVVVIGWEGEEVVYWEKRGGHSREKS